jgi:hypothetical protein
MSLNISRIGEPVLKRGQDDSSADLQNQYEIRTTLLPAWPRGTNWRGYFNKQLPGGRFLAQHDGVDKIVAECWPLDEPQLTEVVDAAIGHANKEEGTITYEA